MVPLRRISERSGVTYLDVVITVLILGILTAVAAPRFADMLQRHRAAAAARQVQADLNLARQFARAKTTSETITFNTAADAYSFSTLTPRRLTAGVKTVELNQSPYLCDLVQADFNGGASVTFNAYGIPEFGGAVVVQCGNHQVKVAVDAVTGLATQVEGG